MYNIKSSLQPMYVIRQKHMEDCNRSFKSTLFKDRKSIGLFVQALTLTPFLIYSRIAHGSLSTFKDCFIDVIAITLENAFFLGFFSLFSSRIIGRLNPMLILLHSWIAATDTTMFAYVGSPLTVGYLEAFMGDNDVESSSEQMAGLQNLTITLLWEIIIIYGWTIYKRLESKSYNIINNNIIDVDPIFSFGVKKIRDGKSSNYYTRFLYYIMFLLKIE